MSNKHNNAPAVPQGDPIAWKYELAVRIDADGRGSGWCWHLTDYKPSAPDGMIRNLRPLTYADAAPAVTQGEPVAAWLKAKIEKHALLAADCPGSSSVVLKSALLRFLDRLPPVAATPATAPAQERCSTCGYLTSEREHLGCLRRAVKDLDIATGGPYDAQEVGLPEGVEAELEELSLIAKGIRIGGVHLLADQIEAIISALRAKGQS